uniref:GATOR complex protein NPRL3 n=1 Tax=Diabrotica virgifera virgifera TaxID=50390 RepID=A0A6P7GFK8_DIAVI
MKDYMITEAEKNLTGFTDEVLSSLFAVKTELCNRKFELKVNDVRFVSHPTILQLRNKQEKEDESESGMLVNIVPWAKQVKCYHDLSKRMGIVLKYEEKRCGYVTEQTQLMTTAHDDGYTSGPGSAFKIILEKCSLAGNIKKMYDDLCSTGLVSLRINRWIPLSFCLPQKVHQWHMRGKIVEPADIDRCLNALRPYHSLLLLHPLQQMNDFTSLDGSPSLDRMLSQYSPLKNLQTLASDSDLTLTHVSCLSWLVYQSNIQTQHETLNISVARSNFIFSVVFKNSVEINRFFKSCIIQYKRYGYCLFQLLTVFYYCSLSFIFEWCFRLENVSFTSTEDDKQDYQEELLLDFPDEERSSIFKIPATNTPEDLKLFARLCRKEYFQGNHHVEEIMYLENLRRSQLLQLLDKFRDVLITYETEDPAIAMFSCSS